MASASIAAVGARGPLGMNAAQIAMCARAQKLVPRGTFVGPLGREIGVCTTGGLDPLRGYERLVALAAPALAAACPAIVTQALPLMLALPERARPDDDPRLEGEVISALAAASGVALDLRASRVFREGRAAGAFALEAALAALQSTPAVLVGGVDSYFHPGVLARLDDQDRLIAEGIEGGLLPSEGAAFLLLTGAGERGLATVHHAATAREPANAEESETWPESSGVSALGDLVQRAALTAKRPVSWVLSDLNGEQRSVLRWADVELRASFGEPLTRHDAVHTFGDAGAAVGPMWIAIAATWWRAGCAPAPCGLVALASDGPERGVVLLEAPA